MGCGAFRISFGRRASSSCKDLKTTIRYGQPYRSQERRRRLIRCLDGCAWVTVDGSLSDRVLAPGQTVVIPARRLALVTGMDQCVVEISDAP
jgi:hypothetical protein